jgi:hypothetical protein
MTVRPSGFFQPDATFARNLFGATPAEAVNFVSSESAPSHASRRWSRRISPRVFRDVEYASSSDRPSTSGVTSEDRKDLLRRAR